MYFARVLCSLLKGSLWTFPSVSECKFGRAVRICAVSGFCTLSEPIQPKKKMFGVTSLRVPSLQLLMEPYLDRNQAFCFVRPSMSLKKRTAWSACLAGLWLIFIVQLIQDVRISRKSVWHKTTCEEILANKF